MDVDVVEEGSVSFGGEGDVTLGWVEGGDCSVKDERLFFSGGGDVLL